MYFSCNLGLNSDMINIYNEDSPAMGDILFPTSFTSNILVMVSEPQF